MHYRAAFQMQRNQADFLLHIQIVGRQRGDAETEGPVLEDEIRRAVVVDELADVAALVVQRTEAFEILIVAIHVVGDGHADTRQLE